MATTVKRAIRTSAEWTANQTAMEALYEVDGYYTLASLWEDSIPLDISTGTGTDEQWIGEIYNDWATGLNDSVDIADHLADTIESIILQSAIGEGHTSTKESGFFFRNFKNFGSVVRISNNYAVVKGIEVQNTGSSSDSCFGFNVGIANSGISECLATDGSIGFISGQNNTYIRNSLAIDMIGDGFNASNYQVPSIDNNKAVNCGVGFAANANNGVLYRNNVAFNCTVDFETTTINASSSNNATSEATLDSGLGTVVNIAASDFANTAIGDYHLSSGSNLTGEGINLYSEFTTDIDGDEWPNAAVWDIGFDYYVSAGPTALNDSFDVIAGQQLVVPVELSILNNDLNIVCP